MTSGRNALTFACARKLSGVGPCSRGASPFQCPVAVGSPLLPHHCLGCWYLNGGRKASQAPGSAASLPLAGEHPSHGLLPSPNYPCVLWFRTTVWFIPVVLGVRRLGSAGRELGSAFWGGLVRVRRDGLPRWLSRARERGLSAWRRGFSMGCLGFLTEWQLGSQAQPVGAARSLTASSD